MSADSLTAAETRALAAIDTDALVNRLTQLLAVPSVGGTDAECDIQVELADDAHDLGLDVDLWRLDLPALVTDPEFPGAEVRRSEAWGLVATSGPGTPALALQGHVDVVPPGDRDLWRDDPFNPVIRGGRIHGRGACDMKAGVVANFAAARAIHDAGLALERTYALHLVAAEEDGGLGAFATMRRGHTAEACIITEPTSGTIVTATAGALTFEIAVAGAATHGSTRYAGHSALDAYLPIHAALGDLEKRRNADPHPLMAEYPIAYPLSVGLVQCGDWASSVPDRLIAQGRLGVAVGEDPAHARHDLETAVADAAAADPWLADHPPVVTWPGGQFASGQYSQAGADLFSVVSTAHADVTGGSRPRERGAPYGSDLRLYAGAGIPTLHYGPGDVRLAHGPKESVTIEELVCATEALVLSLIRTCGIR